MSRRSEIKIRLTDANLEQMKTGRLVIDIEAPASDIEIMHSPLDFNDLPQRVIPTGKNNFRRHKPCCDCAAYAFKADQGGKSIMRMRPHDNIWILSRGKWWDGEFLGYAVRGMVKTNSGAGYCLVVPRKNIKPRTREAVK